MKFTDTPFFRFIIIGGINTVVTYLIYILLLVVFTYKCAYSLSYISGVLISYTLNTVFVFKECWSWSKLFKFPIVYFVQYVFGLLLLTILVDNLNVNVKLAPVINVIIFIPITYILTKMIIKSGVKA